MTDITDPRLEAYAQEHTSPEPEWLRAAAEDTNRDFAERAGMMVGPLEGRFLQALVFAKRPRLVLEIGLFTGYSAMAMAEALPEGGRIVSCDISEEHVAAARRNIARSPYGDRIDIRVGPALETIESLDGPFDFVFIDADKGNYRNYYEAALPKLAGDGMIAADNVLWSGRVLDGGDTTEDTVAIREFNDLVVADDRVTCVIAPVRDGVTLIWKAERS